MKIGGHETFYPRPGWLTKGLLYLHKGGIGTFSLPETANELGVGRNMSKSIGWWLYTLCLASRTSRTGPLELSALGKVILERDPFMDQLGTWWLVHCAAMTSGLGYSLPWFFQANRLERADRTLLVEALSKELSSKRAKSPSLKSIQREVAAVMQTYAVPVPRPQLDPEDNLGSPFQRLDLWRHLRAVDRFERSEPTPAPPEALGLLVSAIGSSSSSQTLEEGLQIDISAGAGDLADFGSYLGRSREELLSIAALGQEQLGHTVMSIRSLAGERVISVSSARAERWAKMYYDRIEIAVGRSAA